MLPFSLTSFFKYLVGVLLIQGVTVLLIVTAYQTDLERTGLLFLFLNLAIGTLTAFWFTSMAGGVSQQALSRAKASFAREREKIRIDAEKAKTKVKEIKTSQRRVSREKQRAGKRGNLKIGLMLGGAAGLGTVMVVTQFVTLGLLTLTTAGGAALGYGLRARQDRLRLGAGQLLPSVPEKPVQIIQAPPAERIIASDKSKHA